MLNIIEYCIFKMKYVYNSKVYSLLLLRTVCYASAECYAIADESVSSFFGAPGGVVVVAMLCLVQLVLSGYASLSGDGRSGGPDSPSLQRRFVTLSVLEGTVWAGAASHLYHSQQVGYWTL